MNSTSPILEVTHLEVRRGGVTVLDIPELTVREGEVISLIGPNGGGKSSLLLALARLIPITGGTIFFRGREIPAGNGNIDYRRKVAMVFQEPLLFDSTVHDNVASGLKIRGMNKRDVADAVRDSLDRFGITHLSDRHARSLSGGEAQRTSLARAFAVRPEIIFLDEPMSSLDPPTREGLIDDLQRILRETKSTAVMATHDRVEVLRLSHRIAVLKDGHILQIAPPEELVHHPLDAFIASFIGMETILPGAVTHAGAGTITIQIGKRNIEAVGSNPPGENVICCIRPENVTLATGISPGKTSARNTFEGTITRIVSMGLFYKVFLDCGFSITAHVTSPSMEILSVREGNLVSVSFKATAVHVLKAG